jgi:hypothetical protein
MASAAALNHVGNRPQVEDAEALGCLVGAMQLAERQHLGQVEEGTGDGGYGDAVVLGAIGWVQGADAVDDNARAGLAAPPPNGDMHPAMVRPHSKQCGSALVAENGIGKGK